MRMTGSGMGMPARIEPKAGSSFAATVNAHTATATASAGDSATEIYTPQLGGAQLGQMVLGGDSF